MNANIQYLYDVKFPFYGDGGVVVGMVYGYIIQELYGQENEYFTF